MKLSALHQSSGLNASVKFPDGTMVNLYFQRGRTSLPIHGQIGGQNFESRIELVQRNTEDPDEEIDLVVVMALPSRVSVENVPVARREHAGTNPDFAALPKEKRSKSGMQVPEVRVKTDAAPRVVSAIQLSPGNMDSDMRPVANQDFSQELPKPQIDPTVSGLAMNPFLPPASYVNKNPGENFKGLSFQEGSQGQGLQPIVEKTAADALTDEEVEEAVKAAGLPEVPTGESDKPAKKAPQPPKPQKSSGRR